MPENITTRWTSFENPLAEKGEGGKENHGAKGHAFDRIPAGQSIDLVNLSGSGVINRIWLTISDRSPEMLRTLTIKMYWDCAARPAVAAPLGDFFGVGLGQRVPFENVLFSDPEVRSFNCIVPMPFAQGARITICNESGKDLKAIFYDVNFVLKEHTKSEMLYFHAYWHRNPATELKNDFQILPKVEGVGLFLGVNMGVVTHPDYENTWFGEGEVKMYFDGDKQFLTLVGTGIEDYVGAAYGQGTLSHKYQGSLIADNKKGLYAFYRYHIPDPVYFFKNIRVTVQEIGGAPTEKVRELWEKGAKLVPISVDQPSGFIKLLEKENPPAITDPAFPEGWTNFYRSDDVSSTTYFLFFQNPFIS